MPPPAPILKLNFSHPKRCATTFYVREDPAVERCEIPRQIRNRANIAHGSLPKSLATHATIDAAHTPRPKPRARKVQAMSISIRTKWRSKRTALAHSAPSRSVGCARRYWAVILRCIAAFTSPAARAVFLAADVARDVFALCHHASCSPFPTNVGFRSQNIATTVASKIFLS